MSPDFTTEERQAIEDTGAFRALTIYQLRDLKKWREKINDRVRYLELKVAAIVAIVYLLTDVLRAKIGGN